jgi:hypothetical protein
MKILRHARRCGIFLAFAATLSFAQSSTFDGYTLVFSKKKAQLYGMDKQVIHEWTCQNAIQCCADLLRDSSIIVSATVSSCAWNEKTLPVSHGRLQIINWRGDITWDYQYCSANYMPHHDIEPVYRTGDPKEKPTFLVPCYTAWGDKIVEIKPTGAKTGEVVWEWVASDHTCSSGCNDKPELIDKSKGGSGTFNKTSDIMHVNGLSYNRRLDQIVVSVKGYDEFFVIDHSTSIQEAKGTTGGKYGKGGSILFRWGKSSNYGMSATSTLNGQHHACWVPDTMLGTKLPITGGGNFMAVNNNAGKNGSVMEITCPGTKNGEYPRDADKAFEPTASLWKYSVNDLNENEGSIQKLPNGNYLVCTGGFDMSLLGGGLSKKAMSPVKNTRVIEVKPSGASAGTVVWELTDIGISSEAYRYAFGYLGGGVTASNVRRSFGTLRHATMRISYNHLKGTTSIPMEKEVLNARLSLYSPSGKELIRSAACTNPNGWDLSHLPSGLYLVKIQLDESVALDRVFIRP